MPSKKTRPCVIVVLGSTASGKSELGVKLAKKLNGEIISADSRQVYRGLDIGSGKITRREMRGVPHHLLDVASLRRRFTVAQYQKRGRRAIAAILKKGEIPIIVGGTGFYIDALLYDYLLPSVKPNLKLRKLLEKKSADELFVLLQEHDPQRAATIDRHNPRRLVRALEIVLQSGEPVPSAAQTLRHSSSYSGVKIGINLPAEVLRQRIHTRLVKRLHQGMVREVKRLHAAGVSWQRLDMLGLEYRWVSRYVRGLVSREEMLATLEQEIWHYAKRQLTWFRRDKEILWVDSAEEAVGKVIHMVD